MRRPRRRRRELLADRVRDGRGDQFVAGVVRVHAVIIELRVHVAMHVIEIREVRVDQDRVVIVSDALDEGRHLDVQDVDVRPLPRWVLGRDRRRHEHDGLLVRGVPQDGPADGDGAGAAAGRAVRREVADVEVLVIREEGREVLARRKGRVARTPRPSHARAFARRGRHTGAARAPAGAHARAHSPPPDTVTQHFVTQQTWSLPGLSQLHDGLHCGRARA